MPLAGGWGPISTPTLLSSGRMEPRKIIGTVDTSEFLVALSASIGFLFALSFAQIPWTVVGALLLGGVIAVLIYILIVAVWIAAIVCSVRVNRLEQNGRAGDPSTSRVV